MKSLHLFCVFVLSFSWQIAIAASVVSADGTDISVNIIPSTGKVALLWLPSQQGVLPQEEKMAAALAAQGVEVWLPDLSGARFLPTTYTSMAKIPPEDVAALIQATVKRTGKVVYIMVTERGTVPALRGINLWRREHRDKEQLHGVLMLSPDLYVVTPTPGKDAQYLPIVDSMNIPMFILQPALSPKRWWVDRLVAKLSQNGAPVFTRYIPETKGRFFFRPDASERDDQSAQNLPVMLLTAMKLLETAQSDWDRGRVFTPRKPVKAKFFDRERKLKPYKGDPQPPALHLELLTGGRMDLKDLKGNVVLVNFWATWCPPCRAEMPSMQRLKEKLKGKPFKILAVDMGETEDKVYEFLKNTPVDFPILMDRDGDALRRWKVFAFPTSYVIGPKGKIRYALYGTREWDTEDVFQLIDELNKE